MALQTLYGAANEMLAGLCQHLNADTFGYAVLLDQFSSEIEFRLGGRGESHLDLLEADFGQEIEQLKFLLHSHGDGQGLIAIPEVDAAPNRSMVDRPARPLTIGQVNRPPWTVLRDGIFLHGNSTFLKELFLTEKHFLGKLGICLRQTG